MITIIIPTYNEQATIGLLIDRIRTNLRKEKQEIIVVDDGSRDGTQEIVKARKVKLIQNPVRTYGDVSQALPLVQGGIIVKMDADLENDPADLRRLITPLQQGKADLVLGRRPRFSRKIEPLLAWWYDPPVKDLFTGYLAFSRKLLPYAQKLAPTPLYWELPLLALALHFRVKEVDVAFPRRQGRSRLGGEIKGGIYSYRLFLKAVQKVEALTGKPVFPLPRSRHHYTFTGPDSPR